MARFRCPHHFFSELVKHLGKTSVGGFLMVAGAIRLVVVFCWLIAGGIHEAPKRFQWKLSVTVLIVDFLNGLFPIPTVFHNDWSS